jgi:fucose permease
LRSLKKIVQYPNTGLILLSFIAFIALGMPDGLLGVAWPSMRASFSVPLDAIGMLISASVLGYLTSSFLSGPLISRLGVGKVLAISCFLSGVPLILYTIIPVWWAVVLLGVVGGLGAGAIDAGLNSYVAANFGEGLMQWLHASYGIGITLGPIIMTLSLANLGSWQTGYRVVGCFQLILAACFTLTLPVWKKKSDSNKEEEKLITEYQTPLLETLRQPQVWLSMLLFFLYVGAETSLGTWAYSLLTESRGVDPTAAGFITSSYWATFTIGRIIAGLFAKKIGGNSLLRRSILAALFGTLLLVGNFSEILNLLAVALIGFAIAPIFPALMSGTKNRVGSRFTANTIGMQMASGGLGTGLIPSLLGILARRFSLEIIPISLVIMFAALLVVHHLSLRKKKTVDGEGTL